MRIKAIIPDILLCVTYVSHILIGTSVSGQSKAYLGRIFCKFMSFAIETVENQITFKKQLKSLTHMSKHCINSDCHTVTLFAASEVLFFA